MRVGFRKDNSLWQRPLTALDVAIMLSEDGTASIFRQEMAMTDYWLSKMFFDLHQDPDLAKAYNADMAAVMARYSIKPEVRRALLADDVAALSPLVNAYLLRFYFQIRRMPQDEFIAKLHAMNAAGEPTGKVSHG